MEKRNKKLEEQSFLNSILVKTEEKKQTIAEAIAIADAERAKEREAQVKQGIEGANKLAGALLTLSKGNKEQTILSLQFAQAAATADAIAGSMKAFKQGGVPGFIMGVALLAEGMAKIQTINAQIKDVKAAATGMDEVVTQPTMILAGEAGAENVQITPLQGPNIDGPQGGGSLTVNVSGNVLTSDWVERDLAEAVKEAVRKGTDFGIG